MTDYSKLTDLELATLLNESDELAYTEIYNRYKGVLYLHAYSRLKNVEEVNDMIQELFAKLWDKRKTLILKTNLSNYLYTAVRNRVIDFIAHKKIESDYISGFQQFINQGEAVTDHLLREKELSRIIEDEIQSLPSKMRQVFELSRKQNHSHREIAYALTLSEKTVKKHVNNALKILRVKLGSLIVLMLILLH
ncbi:RNA polymerase sigma-70 factor (family 1) [Pedobacter africanus]|uniref:RNA polymerase sigma-70 factor (ECF subfamily) n=1 Tax=Pedobacter africanus TaxID=151894 RepID=A0ACC6KYX2_9SPHI|nr:RNA polymerase sigma-70 factor [Pedobacter africanus]MDR6784421.1 RNA polymerase sigma-70 factor (ECF subfamily) [Pedobacter africanus]